MIFRAMEQKENVDNCDVIIDFWGFHSAFIVIASFSSVMIVFSGQVFIDWAINKGGGLCSEQRKLR